MCVCVEKRVRVCVYVCVEKRVRVCVCVCVEGGDARTCTRGMGARVYIYCLYVHGVLGKGLCWKGGIRIYFLCVCGECVGE